MKKENLFELIKLSSPAYIRSYLEKILPRGKWETPTRYRCGDIQGNEGQSFCFDTDIGYAIDFSTGFKGDIVNIVAEQNNLSPLESAKKIAEDWGLKDTQLGSSELVAVTAPQLKAKTKTPAIPKYDFIMPVPPNTNLAIDGIMIRKYGQPIKVYDYRDKNGRLLFHVARFEHMQDGKRKKEFFPFAYSTSGWVKALPSRSLYNLQAFKDKQLFIICEGEKSADAASKLCPYAVCISWSGGASAVHLADWSPLAKQRVFIWRDNDKPGKDAQNKLMPILHEMGCEVRYFNDDFFKDRPEGWDAADVEQFEIDVEAAIREFGVDFGAKKKVHKPVNPYFKVLGMIGTNYAFYNYLGGLIFEGDHSGLNKKFFMQLTSGNIDYWYKAFGEEKENAKGEITLSVNWDSVAGNYFEECQRKGQFDVTSIRGAGTWWDDGRLVTHMGDFLNVDGEIVNIKDFDTKYVYLKRGEVLDKIHEPLSLQEADDLYSLLKRFNWEYKQSPALLLGWLTVAPICGSLDWRPHIYVIGMSGAGKSTIYENIMVPALGASCLPLAGRSTTEAGLRQKANGDALPVIFEEFENEGSPAARQNNEKILELARLASSFSKGKTVKGDKGQGNAKEYSVTACFCFFSISQSVEHYADQNRITPLGLKPHNFKDKKEQSLKRNELTKELLRVVGDKRSLDYSRRFVSTSIQNTRKIIEAYAVFREQGLLTVDKFNPRHSDQIGMLLAGFYVFMNGKVPTPEEAKALLASSDWEDFVPSNDQRNESRLCALLAEQRIKLDNENPAKPHVYNRTIGQLVEFLSSPSSYDFNGNPVIQHPDYDIIKPEIVSRYLMTLGLRVESNFVWISSKSEYIRSMLHGTQWQNDWVNSLKAVDGALTQMQTMYFGGGVGTKRAIGIPVEEFLNAKGVDGVD